MWVIVSCSRPTAKLRVGLEVMPTSATFWKYVPSGLPGARPSFLNSPTRYLTVFSSPGGAGSTALELVGGEDLGARENARR
jgi:hypothetical protein